MINFYNIDCIEFMKSKPDKCYDLAIVDPTYGIDNKIQYHETGNFKNRMYAKKRWDIYKPNSEYFNELRRISKNQIVFGGNYFTDNLPESRGWFFWLKFEHNNKKYSHGELVWTSFDKIVLHYYCQTDSRFKKTKIIHPTQKPINVYRWILLNYAKQGDKIIDTHGGSMSIAIACDMEGFDLDVCELDNEYFLNATKRYNEYKRQPQLL